MEYSLISWCDHTQNFWIGCTHVSPGCGMCYADTLDRNRFSKLLDGGTKDAPVRHWGKGAPRHRTSKSIWNDPLRWDKMAKAGHFVEIYRKGERIARGDIRKLVKVKDAAEVYLIQDGDRVIKVRPRVFCSSLSDLLDPEVEPKMLAEALDVIRRCDGLDWMLLTKRPELWRSRIDAAFRFALYDKNTDGDLVAFLRSWLTGYKPPHIWFGATMEDQLRWNLRIQPLCDIPAVIRFVSMEPMIGPIKMRVGQVMNGFPSHITGEGHAVGAPLSIHMVIVGGESGDDVKNDEGNVIRSPRPMHPEWVRSIRDQCLVTGIAFHFKQWGAWGLDPQGDRCVFDDGSHLPNLEPEGINGDGAVRIRRMPDKSAGHLLDGKEYRAFPRRGCPHDTDGDGDCHLCATHGSCQHPEAIR